MLRGGGREDLVPAPVVTGQRSAPGWVSESVIREQCFDSLPIPLRKGLEAPLNEFLVRVRHGLLPLTVGT